MTAFKLVTIALLGAAGTGKKSLAEALTQALAKASTAVLSATTANNVPLRWQITTDTPLQLLLELVQAPGAIPDSAGIDTNSTDFKEVLAQQRRFDHSLLLGLDIAPSARAQDPQSADERSRMDTLLRRSMTQAEVSFQVIYGVGDEQLRQALTALSILELSRAKPEPPPAESSTPRKPWVWTCDKCSDPACEQQQLSALLLNR